MDDRCKVGQFRDDAGGGGGVSSSGLLWRPPGTLWGPHLGRLWTTRTGHSGGHVAWWVVWPLTFSSVLTTHTVVDTRCRNVLCALADHKVELTLNILNIRCLNSTVIQYCSIKWCIVRETCFLVFICIYCIYYMFFVKEKWKNLQPLTSLTLGPAAVVILF